MQCETFRFERPGSHICNSIVRDKEIYVDVYGCLAYRLNDIWQLRICNSISWHNPHSHVLMNINTHVFKRHSHLIENSHATLSHLHLFYKTQRTLSTPRELWYFAISHRPFGTPSAHWSCLEIIASPINVDSLADWMAGSDPVYVQCRTSEGMNAHNVFHTCCRLDLSFLTIFLLHFVN